VSSAGIAATNPQRANLDRLLDPQSIAFVGGTRAISAWRVTRAKGFAGRIYMVNPFKDEIDGVATYASLADLPEAPDAAYIALDPRKTIDNVRLLRQMGGGGVAVFGAGFSEVGAAGEELERQLLEAAGGLALFGPNCYGIVNHASNGSLWPIDYPQQKLAPNVAFISQSGNIAINVCQNERSVALSHLVSLGNQAGIQVHDLVDHFSRDPAIKAIGVYIDGLKDVSAFHEACLDALARGVAVVVLKAGISEMGAEMAMSHTNSLAGSRAMYEALFARTGVSWVRTIPEMLETLKLFSNWPEPSGNRVAFFSCSGGECSMAADFADDAGLELVQPDEDQTRRLSEIMPDFGGVSNPLDMTTALFGKREEVEQAARIMMEGPSDTAILVMDFAGGELVPGSASAQMAEGLAAACRATGKRAAIATMKPESLSPAIQQSLLDLGILPIQGLDTGCLAITHGARTAARKAEVSASRPRPLLRGGDPAVQGRVLDEAQSKKLLAEAGIPIPRGQLLSADNPVVAPGLSGPVVVKACTAALPHKTEAGGVVLNVEGGEAIAAAADRIRASVRAYDGSIVVERVLVEEMVRGSVAELIVGIKNDPQFGLAIVVGTGGIFVELLKDAATLLLPTDRATVEAAVRGLAGATLFTGFRGRQPGDVAAIVDAVMALADFAARNADAILEADINPLFVLPEGQGVCAGDALLRMTR
jgi:acyl-CoA synthetase (NDP forming)